MYYIKINDKKIEVILATVDDNSLNLSLKNTYGIQETFDLFNDNDLSTINLYTDDDTLSDVYIGFTKIDGFYVIPANNSYMISLNKVDLPTVEDGLNKLNDKFASLFDSLDGVKKTVSSISDNPLNQDAKYALKILAVSFTDEQALNCTLLFDEWDGNNHSYKKDERFRYNDGFYKVLQDHTSQEEWTPDTASSLYVSISDPAIEYPEWKQPSGSHDAYNTGDKVTYKGKKYVSLIDSNTWSPEDYPSGWQLVEE